MLIANEKWSIGTGNGPSSEVVNNPSAFLAVKQKSVFCAMVSREELNWSNLQYAGGLPGRRLIQGLFYCLAGFCDPFLCPERLYFSTGKFQPSQNSFGFQKKI